MKTKSFLLILLLIAVNALRTFASGNDTTWTIYHYNGYSISIIGGDLYAGITSKVLIRSDDPDEMFGTGFSPGVIKPINNMGWFSVAPAEIGKSTFTIIGKSNPLPLTYQVQVYPVPDPKLYFIEDKHQWYETVSKEDILRSQGVAVKNKFTNYEVQSFLVTAINSNGDIVSRLNTGANFDSEIKKLLQNIEIGKKIYFEEIEIRNPDGSKRMIPSQTYKVIDNYENEFIRRTINIKPFSNDLGLLKTDLRIKIQGNPKKEDIQTITDFANELNKVLMTIKVRIVDRQPSLTMVFDSIHDTSARDLGDGIYLRTYSSVFFPYYREFVMYCAIYNGYDADQRSQVIKKNILRLFGNFNDSMFELSLLNNDSELTGYDKYMLKNLYSPGGEDEVKTIINKQYYDPDRSGVFILILILTICLMFVLSEIYHHYGINVLLGRIKYKFLIRIVESVLAAQIPLLAFVLLVLINNGQTWREFGKIPGYELFLVPLFVLWGVFLFFLDMLLIKIRINWLNIIVDFFLTIFCVSLAYQIIYLFKTPEIINFKVLGWELLIIPVLIAFYRLYARFQSKKISGLLQEKELELARQKELKFKSDLNALQARINPHFLYNSLNSLASLAHIDAGRTEQMAISLSRLFRYNINKEEEHYSTIQNELEMTGIYLDVEKNRFGDRLEWTIEIQEPLKEFKIPKFVLQPLVENAVKHGISKITAKGIIKIRIFELAQKVYIGICDNGPEFPGGLIYGYGLQNTYEKLKLLYKKPFSMEFVNEPEKKILITLTK